MSDKVRVHELAKELGIKSGELKSLLKKEGVGVSSHLSIIDPDIAELIKEQVLSENKIEKRPATPQNDKAVKDPSDTKNKEPKADKSTDVSKLQPTEAMSNTAAKQKNEAPIDTTNYESDSSPAREIHFKPPIIVKELASALDLKPNELIHSLLKINVFASINQALDTAIADRICTQYGYRLITDKREKQTPGRITQREEVTPEEVKYDDEEVVHRPPVVTVLGHVDHGKTSLLDRLRDTNVTAGEAGGITQHIGASTVEWQGHPLTFIDTPGHEAFTAMRSRGANCTDIVVLVVAADDGVMPQTIEAINHAKAANVPIVVAINKIDLPSADPLKVMTQLQQQDVALEEWGGEVGVVKVSAANGEGMDDLLERLLLESEILELRANPRLPVKAVVLESQLEQGLGPTINVLVKNGTIHVGDTVISGRYYGKVKALVNHLGRRIKEAGPSLAAKVVGLSGLPEGGTLLVGCSDERQAKKLAEEREIKTREEQLQPQRQANLEDLFRQIEEEARKELKIIVKTDAQGTGEAVVEILKNLKSQKIKVDIIHSGVGAISENDVLLASASDAIIVGFHVRVNPGVNALAQKRGVDIRLYSVIYELAEQIKDAMTGMLDPELREESLGRSEILKVFTPSRGSKICGCSVVKGSVRVGAKARVYRGDELIYNGTIQSLRRFEEDVKTVRQGFECGIRLDHFEDFEEGDWIEVYEYKEVAATL